MFVRYLFSAKNILAGLGLALFLSAPTQAADPSVRLVLLGTKGGPSLLSDKRLPQSTALVIDNDVYLLDAGYGASLRLVQAGLPLARIKGIFLTHMHSDHILDYPSVLMNAWASGLKQPVAVYGPPGTVAMTDVIWKTFDTDIVIRVADEGKPDLRTLVTAHDIGEGTVLDDGRLKVSALHVPHPPFEMGQALAFKFETGGKTIVLSGDTIYFPALADFAKGADILIHEVVHVPSVERLAARIGSGSTLAQAIISHHTVAEDVGRIAQQAGVKKLVLSHMVPADDPALTDEIWRSSVATTYTGPIIVGHDGMEIDLKN